MLEGETRSGRISTPWDLMKAEDAAEIPAAIRLMTAAAEEWGTDLGVIACSMDVKQAFDNVSPESLSVVMKEMGMAPMLAGAILREQIGGEAMASAYRKQG